MGKTRDPMVENILLNARIIAKRKGIKIGELERNAGVSTGYFSRMISTSSQPRIDTIYRLAHALGTTVDILCNCPPEYNQENVVLIHDFASKLIRGTIEGTITWKRVSSTLEGMIEGCEYLTPIVQNIPSPAGKTQYRLSVRVGDHEQMILNTEEFSVQFMTRTMEDLYETASNCQNIPDEVREIIDSFVGGTPA